MNFIRAESLKKNWYLIIILMIVSIQASVYYTTHLTPCTNYYIIKSFLGNILVGIVCLLIFSNPPRLNKESIFFSGFWILSGLYQKPYPTNNIYDIYVFIISLMTIIAIYIADKNKY